MLRFGQQVPDLLVHRVEDRRRRGWRWRDHWFRRSREQVGRLRSWSSQALHVLEQIVRMTNKFDAIAEKPQRASTLGTVDICGNGKHVPPLLRRVPSGDQRAATVVGLNDHNRTRK